jgi:N-acetylglucosamine kinase-like BadF-type ATPase
MNDVSDVLAVDGGQSAIRLLHSKATQTFEVDGVSRLEGDLVATTADAVIHGWRVAGSPDTDLVVLGLTTAPPDADRAEAICRRVGEVIGAGEVWLSDDSITAHHGALSGGPGVALAAGTGVACLAVPPHGSPRLFDGNGYLVGCVGSAYWIGSAGVRAVLRRNDGIGAATDLERVAERRYGPLLEMRERIYAESRPVNAIAQFARDVMEVAAEGDHVASAIIRSAAAELAATASAGAVWVGTRPVDIAVGGKLLAAGTLLRLEFQREIQRADIAAAVRDADASGLIGALRMGLDNAAERYGDLIHRWTGPVT